MCRARLTITVLVALAAALVHFAPGLEPLLQLERGAVAAGAWWRPVTCHLTHWGTEHFAWDLGVFVLIGIVCESISPRRYVVCLVASALAIPLAVFAWAPEVTTYRGLSGVDTALVALLLVTAARTHLLARNTGGLIAVSVLGAALVAKTVYEQITGGAIFVDSVDAGFVPVPVAHAMGALLGAACATVRISARWLRPAPGRSARRA